MKNQVDVIAKISSEIYKKYAFIDYPVFSSFVNSVTSELNEQEISDFSVYKELFKDSLESIVRKETHRLFSNKKTKKEYLDRYIDKYLTVRKEPEKNILELRRFGKFLNSIEFVTNIEDIIILLDNPKIDKILKSITDENLDIIEDKGISFISRSSSILMLVEYYCDNNGIEIKEDDEYSFEGIYDSYNNRLSIEIPNVPILSKDEERRLLTLAQAGDKKAEGELIVHNMKLVLKIANKFKSAEKIQIEDLFQTGCIGLHKAIEKFDLSTDFKFSTYASWWIKQAISRYCQNNVSTIKRPVHVVELYRKISYAKNKLLLELGRNPTYEEIEKETGLTREKIDFIISSHRNIESLDSKIGDNEDTDLYEIVSYDDEDMANDMFNIQLKNKILDILNRICAGPNKDRDIDIFMKRFGLYDDGPMILEDIGKSYNLTRERVRQISDRIFARIAQPQFKRELEPFIHFDMKAEKMISRVTKDDTFLPTMPFYDFFAQFGISRKQIYAALGRLPNIYKKILADRFSDNELDTKTESYFVSIVPNIIRAALDEKYKIRVEKLEDIPLSSYSNEEELVNSLLGISKKEKKEVKEETPKINPNASFPYSLHDIAIVALRLGGINGVIYSKEEIENFLGERYIPKDIEGLMNWVETRQAKDYYFLGEIEYQNFLRNRTLREITLVGLNFGYITGFPMNVETISNFLGIDKDAISREIKLSFMAYNGQDKGIIQNRIARYEMVKKIGSNPSN